MLQFVSALLPPVVVGGAFIIGIRWLMRSEARARAAERAEAKAGGGSEAKAGGGSDKG